MDKPIMKDSASFDAELVESRLIEARGVGKVQKTHAEMGEQLMEQVGQCMGVGGMDGMDGMDGKHGKAEMAPGGMKAKL